MRLPPLHRMAWLLAAVLLLPALSSLPAWAHGGRFMGPGGRGVPGDPTAPSPSGPKRGKPPVTPGTGIPTTRGALPDVYWGSWWALNRWAYLPERGAALRKRLVTTGSDEPPLRESLTRDRRALLARQHIKPFLLHLLDPETDEKDTVTSAALIALAKISNDEATLSLLLRVAEDAKSEPLERESAALAVGLLRRTDPALRLDPISLDLARTRLLELLDDKTLDIRGRAFAAFSLGLLADQGYGSPFSKDGRIVVKGLLKRLHGHHRSADLPVAYLTALGMQPRAGIPTSLYDKLRKGVTQGTAFGRSLTPIERSHSVRARSKKFRYRAWWTTAPASVSS